MEKILIYGSGGFGREVAWLASQCGFDVTCFIDDNPNKHGEILNGIPVISLEEAKANFANIDISIAIGPPKVREMLTDKAIANGFNIASLVHPRIEKSKWVNIGEGAVLCAGNILTTNIALKKGIQINLDCTIGHDVIMDDFTTLAPGVHVSGWVHFGKRVYVGTGAVILQGTEDKPLTIGDDAIIGAGACVTKPVEAGTTVVGLPAKPIKRN